MMARLIPALLCLLLFAGFQPARAQTFNTETGRKNITSLDGLWRFHAGDNPAWASPNFNDSKWPLLRSDESWTKQGYPNYLGYAWYRFTLQVPDGSKPLALLLPTISSAYWVYADGERIGRADSMAPSHSAPTAHLPQMFRIPAGRAGPQTIEIALRVFQGGHYVGGGPKSAESAAGDPILLARRVHAVSARMTINRGNSYALGVFSALMGLLIFGLFLFRREDREYLWFAVLMLVGATGEALHVGDFLYRVPFIVYQTVLYALDGLFLIAALAFFSIVLHARRSWLWWIAVIAAAIPPIDFFLLLDLHWFGVVTAGIIRLGCTLPAYLWIIAQLWIGTLRKDTSARLLLVPAGLEFGYSVLMEVLEYLGAPIWHNNNLVFVVNPLLLRHPFPLYLAGVIDYIFVVALLAFLVHRFALARQEETRLSHEFEAARSVQSFLVPAQAPDTPGFTVESVYLPASEVGGDFFQILPGDDGALLVVVGDVSGKGLKAAMTVSTVIGALRDRKERQPAQVLAHLNRVLHGQVSGFVTCSATLITADGAMAIANAGHLSPYRNGEELAVDPGLPLGIVAEIDYAETIYQLAPGDRLTFVSDGVVEATNRQRELFGFARTQAISAQPANSIAEAARQFGQQDDISVVTVARAQDYVQARMQESLHAV